MTAPRVSIRLGTDGKAQVVKDFADIGDAGDVQSKRIARAFERDSALAEASLEKLNKTAQRLAAISPVAGGPSNLINPITGGSYAQADGAAERSARSISTAYREAEGSAQRLLASLDPLYAAQLRYDQALAEATQLQRLGVMSSDQLANVQVRLKAQLDDATAIYGKQGSAIGNTRIAQMELMHVVRGSVDQYAAGAAPMQIFTMHLGMLGQAAALSGESMGKFGAFMASGWGLALTVAVVALGPLVTKLIEGSKATDDLVGKLKEKAHQDVLSGQADDAFAASLDGVREAARKNKLALKGLSDEGKTNAENILKNTLVELGYAEALRASTKALLDKASAGIESRRFALQNADNPQDVLPLLSNLDDQQRKINSLRRDLSDTDAAIATAQDKVYQATMAVYAEAAQKDPVQLIKDRYKTLITDATNRLTAEHKTTAELQKQVVLLGQRRDAEVKAYEDAHRKPGANAGGTAIFDSQIAAFFDEANKFRGDSETGNKGVLEAFFREANIHLDPEKTAWCAAFVNAVLANQGVHGTGSLAARSFLNFGKDDTHSPQKGDIVVLRTGAGEHVGFLDSINNRTGAVSVLAGNTGNRVGEATYSKNQVLAIRRPPTPSEAAANDNKLAEAAQRELASYDDELAKLHQRTLAALGSMKSGYEVSAQSAQQQAQAEHDAEAVRIANNLVEGKYGAATGELAQTRARELQTENDTAFLQQRAAIAFNAYLKWIEGQQHAADQRYQYQLEDLRFADDFARSSKEHRDLQLKMLDIQYQQKEYDLQILKSKQQLAGDYDAAARTQEEINRLPVDKAHDQARTERSNLSPWGQYLDTLPHTIDEINDAFQKAGLDGLQSFNDGLANAIVSGKSLGDVLHQALNIVLTDLIKLSEQLAESALFGNKLGGGGGGLSSILSALFNIGGAVIGAPDLGGTVPVDLGSAAPLASLPGGFATGTQYAPGGTAWVGEFGRELVTLPRGSKVTPAAESRRIAAANDGAIGAIHITNNIDATGADSAELARTRAELAQLNAELPGRVVAAVVEAKSRNILA